MALPTLGELKSYLRVETNAEDSVITDILASGKAWAGRLLGRPMTAASKVMGDLSPMRNSYTHRHVIYANVWPLQSSGLSLKDGNGDTVDAGDYTVDVDSGKLVAVTGKYFGIPPYEITATAGYSAGTSYATDVEPNIRALIMGLCAILYKQRNPKASSDSGGGGVSVSYDTAKALPEHLTQLVELIRGPRIR